MESFTLQSTYKIHSGYEIPIVGLGGEKKTNQGKMFIVFLILFHFTFFFQRRQ